MNTPEITDFQTQVKASQAAILHFEQLLEDKDTVIAFSSGSALARSDAENILADPTTKQKLCAGLESVSEDLDKITEKVTNELWLMVIAGTVFIPQNPVLYAWAGILVYRATVKMFCYGVCVK